MLRTYIAVCDDGHDYMELEYQSEHKANSRANRDDAYRELGRKYGYLMARRFRVIETYLDRR